MRTSKPEPIYINIRNRHGDNRSLTVYDSTVDEVHNLIEKASTEAERERQRLKPARSK